MVAKKRAYYQDSDESSDTAFIVVETGDEGVRVIEDRGSHWSAPYWMPEDEFEQTVESLQKVGILKVEKFDKVVKKATETIKY